MNHGVLREHHVEALVGERELARCDFLVGDAVAQSLARGPGDGAVDEWLLDFDTMDAGGAVVADQGNVDATDAATHIEHRLAGDVDAVERHGDLVGAAGRQEAFAPDQLKGLDKFVGVFVFVFLVVGHGDSSLIDRVFGKIVPSIHGHENGAPTNVTD